MSKAGWRDAAAKTVTVVGLATPQLINAHPPEVVPPNPHDVSAKTPRIRALITRELHADVGGLDDRDRRHPGLEVQLIDRLAREKRNEAVRTGLDLDLRRDAILDDARDNAGEPIAGGLLHRLFALAGSPWLRDLGERFAVDQPLPASCPHGDEPAV